MSDDNTRDIEYQRVVMGAIGAFVLAPLVFFIGAKHSDKRYGAILKVIAVVWALAELYFLHVNLPLR